MWSEYAEFGFCAQSWLNCNNTEGLPLKQSVGLHAIIMLWHLVCIFPSALRTADAWTSGGEALSCSGLCLRFTRLCRWAPSPFQKRNETCTSAAFSSLTSAVYGQTKKPGALFFQRTAQRPHGRLSCNSGQAAWLIGRETVISAATWRQFVQLPWKQRH